MKTCLLCLAFFVAFLSQAQTSTNLPGRIYNKHVVDAKRLEKPPFFTFGKDSLQRYYFSHFAGFDSLLTHAIEAGDTARYIRVYFSFTVDENGSAYDPHFERIASTPYGKGEGARTIAHFESDRPYYEQVVKDMIHHMPFWKPGLINVRNANMLVACESRVTDFIQFWVGINPPVN